MSTFLLVYDRQKRQLLRIRKFDAEEREAALSARHDAETEFGPGREVVLLEANSEGDLRKTHARYFGGDELGRLASTASGGTLVISNAVDVDVRIVGDK
jgi:hypothetical protein